MLVNQVFYHQSKIRVESDYIQNVEKTIGNGNVNFVLDFLDLRSHCSNPNVSLKSMQSKHKNS